ncbi:MAG: DNA recombination protein RmuC [Acidobacteriota bacterium]|nr:DNA recombination protein RmuC [Acidobacteriota bacterium]
MSEAMSWLLLLFAVVSAVLLILILVRLRRRDDPDGALYVELRAGREEASRAARESREEISKNLNNVNETVSNGLTSIGEVQRAQLDGISKQMQELSESNHNSVERLRTGLEDRVTELSSRNEQKLEHMRCALEAKIKENEEELSKGLQSANETLATALTRIGEFQATQLEVTNAQFKEINESNRVALDRVRNSIDSQIKELQQGNKLTIDEIRRTVETKLAENRIELSAGLKSADETLSMNLRTIADVQRTQVDGVTKQLQTLTESNQEAIDRICATIDSRLHNLQDSNEKKLEEMRKTVDEKLHDTLEKRLGQSFKLVGDQLEAVHRGLGDMQNLASGVGDLKRLLSNVKVRANWSEKQLETLLEQFLAPGQYQKNFHAKENSDEAVEFAVRLPGSPSDSDSAIWVPIDSKFPQEDYRRLQQAAESGDVIATQKAVDALMRVLKSSAQRIHDKYINPPRTTDFAIMFLGTEGLYGEALRHESLVDELQRRYRIVVAGPTTLAAILTSYRLGFQSLAIEQRAAEVRNILGAVKTEFGKFGEVLAKVKKQLATTTKTIEFVGVRTNVMVKKLKDVEQLSEDETAAMLALPEDMVSDDTLGIARLQLDDQGSEFDDVPNLDDSEDATVSANEESYEFDDIPF